ncbi:cytochrome c nitrite reductase small subunit [Salinimicrobium sp. HB62]|uniref:cytochrome c nitrite reductase small subunit n=1 Tax=Salinimicrobium sp. HB62 TaxID=3077781 RepID=UPI002D767085|nr:cytochrome c nitrite reductase small subunit [Salinimicrobium sp. HB62]
MNQPAKKKSIFRRILPPRKWGLAAAISMGAFLGLGFYVLKLSNATSYLSDDPKACINCHVMMPQYLTWNKSSHREVASCNDCHVPHNNVFNQYYFKAMDGLYHSTIFTLRAEPEVIKAREASAEVIQNNCIRCHDMRITDPKIAATVDNHEFHRTDRTCWECHREVPHGRVKSLSAVGYQIEPVKMHIPEGRDIIPSWLKSHIAEEKENDTLSKVEQETPQ